MSYVKLNIVAGVDLALGVKNSSDYTACIIMGRSPSGQVYILDAQRIQEPFHQVLLFIQQMANKWRPSVIAIEQVQYQAAVVQELLRTTTLPVIGVRPDKDKLTRFLPLLARYEQSMVCHAIGLASWFEDELLMFPMGEHDDGVDAAAYAFSAIPPDAVPDYSQGGMSRAFEVAL